LLSPKGLVLLGKFGKRKDSEKGVEGREGAVGGGEFFPRNRNTSTRSKDAQEKGEKRPRDFPERFMKGTFKGRRRRDLEYVLVKGHHTKG